MIPIPLGVRDRICISRYPDSHLSRSNSSIGEADFPYPQYRVALTAAQLSFVLIPEVYPKTVVWKGNVYRHDGSYNSTEKPTKKDVWKRLQDLVSESLKGRRMLGGPPAQSAADHYYDLCATGGHRH